MAIANSAPAEPTIFAIADLPWIAPRGFGFVDEIDVTALLPLVKAPTLVLHARGDAVQPFEEGRQTQRERR